MASCVFKSSLFFSFFPLHLGIRWYWKDFEFMERCRSQNFTAVGGKSSSVVRVALVSGTKPISYAAVWRLSMTM